MYTEDHATISQLRNTVADLHESKCYKNTHRVTVVLLDYTSADLYVSNVVL